jgi:hypothetical protein
VVDPGAVDPGAVDPGAVDPASLRSAEREESGLRMIGSLGRDRAEASGELASLGQSRPRRSETARELVTILPRRITRELPVVTAVTPVTAPAAEPTADLSESLPMPTPTPPVLAPRPAVVPAIEPPPAPAARVSLPGSGVRAPSRSRRILRIARPAAGRGPGIGAVLLIILATLLAGTAMLLRLRRHARSAQRVETIQEMSPAPAREAMPDVPAPRAAAPDTGSGQPEVATPAGSGRPEPAGGMLAVEDKRAAVKPEGGAPIVGGGSAADATRVGPDGGKAAGSGDRPKAGGPAAGSVDRVAEAKALYDKAHDALDEGDFARAFQLSDASLKLRRTARTYLLRAQAQQRLDRVEDALASVDAAAQLAPGYGTAWELRGRILWAARRHDEARAAFEKFLELEPNGPRAAAVRRLLDEPR